MAKLARHALLEQLVCDGTTYVFGNPGTTEQGFMDALFDFPQLEYILCLHEGVAVSAADAYDPFTGGFLARLDSRGRVEPLLSARGPGDLAFSSAGGPFGDRLWLDTFTSTQSVMYGFDSTFSPSGSACAKPRHFVFDASGAFDYALYSGGGRRDRAAERSRQLHRSPP